MNSRKLILILLLILVSACENFNPASFAKRTYICSTTSNPFGGGSGTSSSPYLICSRSHLQNMGLTSYQNKNFRLEENINLGGSSSPFTPIGLGNGSFSGTLNGNNKTISNFYYHDSAQTEVGLFSSINSATISNLTLTGASVEGQQNVGILAGYSSGSTISNINLSGTVVTASSAAGLMFGTNENGANITYSSASGSVSGVSSLGGLVGSIQGGVINNITLSSITVTGTGGFVGGLVGSASSFGTDLISYITISSGTVSGFRHIGGIAGMSQINISACRYTGNVTASNSNVGGIIGNSQSGTTSLHTVSGNIQGDSNVGGIVGVSGSTSSISFSIYSGSVTATTGGAGGILGNSTSGLASIVKSGASGTITSADGIGGIVGYSNDGPYTFQDVYSDASIVVTAAGGQAGGIVGTDANGFTLQRAIYTGTISTSGLGDLTAAYGLGNTQNSPIDSYYDITKNPTVLDNFGYGIPTAQINDANDAIYGVFSTTYWNKSTGSYPILKTISY